MFRSSKTSDKKKRITYDWIPCPNCGHDKSFPFTNDGGSILVCNKCKHVYAAKQRLVEESNNLPSYGPDSWTNYSTPSSSEFATLEDMNKML